MVNNQVKSVPLIREQARTLNAIRKYYLTHGYKIPPSKHLAQLMQITVAAANMRMHRLKKNGFLIKTEAEWRFNEAELVTEIESAKILLKLHEITSKQPDGKVIIDIFISEIIKDNSIDLNEKKYIENLLEKAIKTNYLVKVGMPPIYLRIGEQFVNQFEYIKFVANP